MINSVSNQSNVLQLYSDVALLPLEVINNIVGRILHKGIKQESAGEQHYLTCVIIAAHLAVNNENEEGEDALSTETKIRRKIFEFIDSMPEHFIANFYRNDNWEESIPERMFCQELVDEISKNPSRLYAALEQFSGTKRPLIFEKIEGEDLKVSSREEINTAFSYSGPLHFYPLLQFNLYGLMLKELEKLKEYFPLHWAAFKGDLDTVLLSSREDACTSTLNNEGWQGLTPFHLAAARGNLSAVNAFIQKGASPNIIDYAGRTPLHAAALGGHARVVEALLKAGVLVNDADKTGNMPLHLAAAMGECDVAKLLIKAGADVTVRDLRGLTPIHLAAQEGHFNMIRVLFDAKASLDAAAIRGKTPLHMAAECENFCEATNKHLEVIKGLIQLGADPDAKDSAGRTPLHNAVIEKRLNTLTTLIEAGASVNVQDYKGSTPLHDAALRGSVGIGMALIAAGASVDVQEDDGQTPLHRAAACANVDFVKLLLQHGASLTITDKVGRTVFDRARGAKVMEALKSAGDFPDELP